MSDARLSTTSLSGIVGVLGVVCCLAARLTLARKVDTLQDEDSRWPC